MALLGCYGTITPSDRKVFLVGLVHLLGMYPPAPCALDFLLAEKLAHRALNRMGETMVWWNGFAKPGPDPLREPHTSVTANSSE